MHERILVLVGKNVDMFPRKVGDVEFVDIYNRRVSPFIIRILRNIELLAGFALDKWKKEINDYSTIIIFDSDVTVEILGWIKRHKSASSRVIFYYRNTIISVSPKLTPCKLQRFGFELWSYNLRDCKKYRMHYNSQVLYINKLWNKKNSSVEYDLVFLGYAKERLNYLIAVKEQLKKQGLKMYFYIPDVKIESFPENQCLDGKPIEYWKYINIVLKSKAILDIVSNHNYGLTLRPLEAMIFQKKLITNYDEINRYDFYIKDNIYIINQVVDKNIINFLNDPYKRVDQNIIERYELKQWIERFLKR